MKQRIVRVYHIRCNEWSDNTYLVAPKGKTAEQIETDVETAQDNYLNDKIAFKTDTPKPEILSTDLSAYPDTATIAEAKGMLKRSVDHFNQWDAEYRKASRSFSQHMRDLGYKTLNMLDEEEDECCQIELDWGHRHGEDIAYEDTINRKDRERTIGRIHPPEYGF